MIVPLTFVGQLLASPEGLALIGSVVAWFWNKKTGKSKRAKVIAERAGIVFDGMEQWARYQRANGNPVTGSQKFDKYVELVEAAVKAVGGGKLSDAEKVGLAADTAVRSWLAKSVAAKRATTQPK